MNVFLKLEVNDILSLHWWTLHSMDSLHCLDLVDFVVILLISLRVFNWSPIGQNGHLFADDIFIFIFVSGKFCSLIKKKSLKFAPKCQIDNNPALVRIMAWCRQAIIWTNANLIHRHIHAALGGVGLTGILHYVRTFSALLALCEGNLLATGGFPSQRPVTHSFDVFIDLCLNKRLSKQSRRRWDAIALNMTSL